MKKNTLRNTPGAREDFLRRSARFNKPLLSRKEAEALEEIKKQLKMTVDEEIEDIDSEVIKRIRNSAYLTRLRFAYYFEAYKNGCEIRDGKSSTGPLFRDGQTGRIVLSKEEAVALNNISLNTESLWEELRKSMYQTAIANDVRTQAHDVKLYMSAIKNEYDVKEEVVPVTYEDIKGVLQSNSTEEGARLPVSGDNVKEAYQSFQLNSVETGLWLDEEAYKKMYGVPSDYIEEMEQKIGIEIPVNLARSLYELEKINKDNSSYDLFRWNQLKVEIATGLGTLVLDNLHKQRKG